jgi:hypothetical protein
MRCIARALRESIRSLANVKHTAIELQDRGLDSESAMCKSTAPHSISSRVKELLYPGKKTPFLRHFILKVILLPRQAWDNLEKLRNKAVSYRLTVAQAVP